MLRSATIPRPTSSARGSARPPQPRHSVRPRLPHRVRIVIEPLRRPHRLPVLGPEGWLARPPRTLPNVRFAAPPNHRDDIHSAAERYLCESQPQQSPSRTVLGHPRGPAKRRNHRSRRSISARGKKTVRSSRQTSSAAIRREAPHTPAACNWSMIHNTPCTCTPSASASRRRRPSPVSRTLFD